MLSIAKFKQYISHYKVRRPLLLFFFIFAICDLMYITFVPLPAGQTEGQVTLTARIRKINYDNEGSIKSVIAGNMLCYVNSQANISPGDIITITGTRKNFSVPMNRGAFNLKKYYLARNVHAIVYATDITVTSKSNAAFVFFDRLSERIAYRIHSLCHFEADTVIALLLGHRGNVSDERNQIYRMAGVSHFFVISGLHISAIGSFIYNLCKLIFKKRIPSCIAAIIFLLSYGFIVGFEISVIRALIMFFVRLFSYVVKRTYDQLSALSLSGIITLLIYPYMLTDQSFIYSYVTVATISIYSSVHKPSKGKSPGKRIYNLFSLPLTLSLFIMPITLYFSGSYSLLSVIYNMILIPLSLPVLCLSGIVLIASSINAGIIVSISDFLLHVILIMLDKFFSSATTIHSFTISGSPHIIFILFYYAFLGLIFYYCVKHECHLNVNLAAVIMTSVLLCFESYKPSDMISMLYVGQGECVVIKTGANSAVISDCGSSNDSNLAKYTVIPWLKAAGIYEISGIFLSHPDADHTNAVSDLITLSVENGISIRNIFIPDIYDISSMNPDSPYHEIIKAADSHKIIIMRISKNDSITFNGLHITCLAPDKSQITGDTNKDSMVLLAKKRSFSILLTGDISSEQDISLSDDLSIEKDVHLSDVLSIEKDIHLSNVLNVKNDSFNILKIPHHGSSSSTSDILLESTNPKLAIISAGISNRYGHPHKEVLERLRLHNIPYLVTSEVGEIDIFPAFTYRKIFTYVPDVAKR